MTSVSIISFIFAKKTFFEDNDIFVGVFVSALRIKMNGFFFSFSLIRFVTQIHLNE